MLFFWLAAAAFVGLLALLFRVERRMLLEDRARTRALLVDAIRLVAVAAMFLALPVAEPRPLATIGLGLAAFAFIAVPSTWMLAIGGMDQKWDLRRVQDEAAALMARYPSPMPADGAEKMRRIARYVRGLRTSQTAELCDLLIERYDDWVRGSHSPLCVARRSIRIYDLQRGLYPEDVRPMEQPEQEATFRWRLYRTVMGLADCGLANPTVEQEAEFRDLLTRLAEYRRDDTAEFVDGWRTSGEAWLSRGPSRGPWKPGAGATAGGKTFEDLRGELWPRTSTFWGAILDEEDHLELRTVRRLD